MLGDENQSRFGGALRGARRAVTMLELLVVVVIMAILLGAIVTASSVLITRAETKNTEAVLQVVDQALIAFEREQKARPTLAKSIAYKKRYGLFPPDEFEVFTLGGVPGGRPGSRAPGRAVLVPSASLKSMTFYSNPADPAHDAAEHRDLVAMITAIEILGDESKAILDGIPDKNRAAGPVDNEGNPTQFLDQDRDGKWSAGDRQIQYILDAWGTPLSYFAQRNWASGSTNNTPSTNHVGWNEASTELIRLNRGRPIIMSYGPDGAEQLTLDIMGKDADASIVGDIENNADGIVDHPFNADNVFLNNELKEKMLTGIHQ